MPPSPILEYRFLRLRDTADLPAMLAQAHPSSLGADHVLVLSFDSAQPHLDGLEAIAPTIRSFQEFQEMPEERYVLLESASAGLRDQLNNVLYRARLACVHHSLVDERIELLGRRSADFDRVLNVLLEPPHIFTSDQIAAAPSLGALARTTVANVVRDMFQKQKLIARRRRARSNEGAHTAAVGQGRALRVVGPRYQFSPLWFPVI